MRLLIDVLKDDTNDAKEVLSASDVVISGGGALALKMAEKCIKNGVKTTILFRKIRDQIDLTAADIDEIESKGVTVIFNAAITAIAGEDDQLLKLEYTILDTLLKKEIPANILIISAGRFPELIFTETVQEDTSESTSARPMRWEAVEVYKSSSQTTDIGMLSKLNPATDYSSAIKAINAGRKAAASIHQTMYGIIPVSENVVTSESRVQNVDHVAHVALTSRQIMPLCSVEDLDVCKEIEEGFTQEAAQKEAQRCLQCGLICYKKAEPQAALRADAA